MVADASDRFVVGASLRVEGDEVPPFTVVSVSPKGDDFIVRLSGVIDRNTAEGLVGTRFVVPSTERRSLEDDEWWVEDLIGCAVMDEDGRVLGVVSDVVSGPAQDRLVVERDGGVGFEVPLVEALVPTVDVGARIVTVSLPDGLIDEQGPTR